MKKIIIVILALLPLCAMAQSEWERPLTAAEKLEQAKKAEAEAKRAVKEAKKAAKKAAKEAKKAKVNQPKQQAGPAPQVQQTQMPSTTVVNEIPVATVTPTPAPAPATTKASWEKNDANARYLAGAVPVVNGKVVFTLDIDVPGKDAEEIFNSVYAFLDNQAKEEKQKEESGITLFNKKEHVVAARYSEWLQFRKNTIMLDQTEFNYTIIANCTNEHLKMTLERINYVYEENRPDGIKATAETWITDDRALNKKKTKLAPMTGKFRRKTIDRKDEIFTAITQMLNGR